MDSWFLYRCVLWLKKGDQKIRATAENTEMLSCLCFVALNYRNIKMEVPN